MGRLVQLDSNFTDLTLPKFYPNDPLLNDGSLFLFDFLRTACYPSQAASVGVGTAFNNLMPNSPGMTSVGAGSYSGGGVGGTNFNPGNNYNLAPTNANFLLIMWLKVNTAGSAYAKLAGRGTTTNPGLTQSRIDMGQDGLTPRFSAGGATEVRTINVFASSGAASQFAIGQVVQLAAARVGTQMIAFKNGAQTGAITMIDTALADPAVTVFDLGNTAVSLYRAYLENLTVSTKTALAQVQADYAANTGRFS